MNSVIMPNNTTRIINNGTSSIQRMNTDSRLRQMAQLQKFSYLHNWLSENIGITDSTIKEFSLGLPFKEYTDKNGILRSRALIAPVRLRDGTFFKKNIYINIPGFTLNPIHEEQWVASGMSAMTYYSQPSGIHRYLIITDNIKDLWRYWQELLKHGLTDDYLIISSSHKKYIPNEWTSDFFAKYDRIYLAFNDNNDSDTLSNNILGRAGCELHKIEIPDYYGNVWIDFWNKCNNIDVFAQLLREAPVLDQKVELSTDEKSPQLKFQPGRRSYKPIDIRGAYHNGHLYYVTETLNGITEKDINTGDEDNLEFRETVVVRSDSVRPRFFRAFYQPAPKNTPLAHRVLRLEDGTLIKSMPQPSGYETWEFDDILDFVNGTAIPRPLKEIVSDINELLKATIWLPHEEDYITLSLLAPVTFVQKVFESVPFILMNGPKGTGKSQVAIFMADLCCNGNLATAPTPAQIFRHVDSAQGFVAFDDLEAIGSTKSKDNGTDELMQVLKVSYNQNTAKIQRVDPKTMRPVEFNCFGVKLFTNILGSDAVLGSRMIRIQTQNMPNDLKSSIRPLSADEKMKIINLRKELHAWAFSKVTDVDHEYQKIFKNKTSRDDEIAAPLRVMANLIQDSTISSQLEVTLSRQNSEESTHYDSPEKALDEALKNLVIQGFKEVTLTHISLEIETLMETHSGQEFSNQLPLWKQPNWIGKTLATAGLTTNTGKRKRFFGKNLRIHEIRKEFVEAVTAEFIQAGHEPPKIKRSVDDFCSGCNGCQYRFSGCELKELRRKAELSPKVSAAQH